MFKSETLSQVAIPAAVLFGVTFIVALLFNSYFEVLPQIIACLIYELFALITCYYLVIRKNKSRKHIWANYIIWTLFCNFGILAETFGF